MLPPEWRHNTALLICVVQCARSHSSSLDSYPNVTTRMTAQVRPFIHTSMTAWVRPLISTNMAWLLLLISTSKEQVRLSWSVCGATCSFSLKQSEQLSQRYHQNDGTNKALFIFCGATMFVPTWTVWTAIARRSPLSRHWQICEAFNPVLGGSCTHCSTHRG